MATARSRRWCRSGSTASWPRSPPRPAAWPWAAISPGSWPRARGTWPSSAPAGPRPSPARPRPGVGEPAPAFARRVRGCRGQGEQEPLAALTAGELHEAGEHELMNWIVVAGAVTPARAELRYFGELPRINLTAVEWRLA